MNVKCLLLAIILICVGAGVNAQNNKGFITGKLTDTSGTALTMATIAVFNAGDSSLITYRLSNLNGVFNVPGLPVNQACRVIISHSGSSVYRKEFTLNSQTVSLDMGTISLEPESQLLEEILVVAERPPVIVRKDTIEFNAEAFKTLPSALLEDLLRKLPGTHVDAAGNITFNGKRVNRLLVEGKEFFGSDPQMATKNLPANIIDKVQFSDDKDELAQNPSLLPGEVGSVINLTLKKAIKQGWFGKIYGGAGDDKRYEAGAIANIFRDTLQLSVLGYVNNLNRPGFSMGDISSLGGFGRTGVNSMMVSSDGAFAMNGISFGGRMGGGITRSAGAGFNLNHQVGKKLTLNLRYFYGETITDQEERINREQFFGDTLMRTTTGNLATLRSRNHIFGGNLKYQIDSLSRLEYRPGVKITNGYDESIGNIFNEQNYAGILNKSTNIQSLTGKTVEVEQSLNYYKNFKKQGRVFNIFSYLTFGGTDNNQFNNAISEFGGNAGITEALHQLRVNDINRLNGNLNFNFTEPISKRLSLQIRQRVDYFQHKDNVTTYNDDGVTMTYDAYNDSLSNGINRTGTRSNSNLSVRYTLKKLTIAPGLNYQMLSIDNKFLKQADIPQHFNYFFPSLELTYGIFRFDYSVNATEPQVSSLQPVANNTNPLFIQLGNPTLRPSVNHSFMLNAYRYNVQNSSNFNAYLYGSFQKDGITQARTVNNQGVQITQPVNIDNVFNLDANVSYGKQYKFSSVWKSGMNASIFASYGKTPLIINEVLSNAHIFRIAPSIRANVNYNDKVEFNTTYRPNYNKSLYQNNVFPGLDNVVHYINTELILRTPGKWVWEANLDYRNNVDAAAGIQPHITRLNAAVHYLFLKEDKGQLKLSVFDLLNQNTMVNRMVQQNFKQDTEVNVLQRYFLLTFTYNIREFRPKKIGGRESLFLF